MKRLFSISFLGILTAVLALSVRGAMSSEENYQEKDFYVQDIAGEDEGDEEAGVEEHEVGETEPELEIVPSVDLYEDSEPHAQDLEEDDSEDEASEEEADAEEEEPELVLTPPKRTIKNEVDEYLKSSGLEFKPYFPDDVYPITPSGESAYKRLPPVEPIILVPDEEGASTDTDEGKQEEEGQDNNDEGSAETDEETQQKEGEENDE